ncbi:MAG: alpha/beta hydrolase, partial [Myxococcales bacterium]|nr:alpha/beta hydrolase [Myxococcales bacterium]
FAGFAETVDPLEEIAIMAEAVQQCHDRLAATVDLSAFNTSSNSDDVDDLRRALGYDRWSLYGVSYGTRLALETMRRHGEHIEFVILDSVYPPEVGGLDWAEAISLEAVPRVISGCLEEASCGAQFPGLEQNLVDAMAMLDAEPFLAETNDSQGTNHQLQLSGADMYAGLFNALYDPSVIPMVPLLIAIAGNGNFNFLNLVADGALPGLIGLSEGARYSMDCSDWGTLAIPAAGALEASLAAHPELSTLYVGHSVPFCAAWDVEPAPPEFLEGVVSDLPTLVLAGEFDPVTPVAQSQQTASRLSQSAFYVFPGLGHGPSYNTDCAATMVRDFLVAGAVVDDGCWAAIPTTTFP